MRESDLYEFAFGIAAIGGLVVGLLGLAYQLFLRWRDGDAEPSIDARAAFHDARIIACLSLVPQCSLLSLPLIYPTPRDVPTALGPAGVFVAAMLFCTWAWLLAKLWTAGTRVRAWFSLGNMLVFSSPVLALLVLVAASLALGIR